VDQIHYPKCLAGSGTNPLWAEMGDITHEIRIAAQISRGSDELREKINLKTKLGPALRTAAREKFEIATGNQFLAECVAVAKKQIPAIRAKISALQVQQKTLLPKLRLANVEYLTDRKKKKAELQAQDAAALASGEFWTATPEAIKSYFHPPFSKNYLADVSAPWRAALFLECESSGWKAGKGDWRHKLVATGRAYLCGIDDNGDEWGYHIRLRLNYDQFGDMQLCATVDEAVMELFHAPADALVAAQRQGDLLFCPAPIPPGTEMRPQEKWEIRESHEVWSPGLRRNGNYLQSNRDIVITHTSHEMLVLPPGSYQLHTIAAAAAD